MGSSRTSSHRPVKRAASFTSAHISGHRLKLAEIFIFLLFLTILFQNVQLSFLRQPDLAKRAAGQNRMVVEVPPLRGEILDRNGEGLAINLKVPSVYAVPRILNEEEKRELILTLKDKLSLAPAFLRERFDRNKAFVWLKRRVSVEEAKKISALENPALGIMYEHKRFYPHGELLANVLGFTNVDNQGIEGIERMEDKGLRGKGGYRYTRRDAWGREIKAFEERMIPAIHGHKVVLTIDRYLQYATERALERAYRKWKAKGAVAILMDPHTGEILAMATRPTFDPNQPGNFPFENYRNRAITDMFEPGSVFKIVTATALLQEKKVNMTEKIFCENGEWTWGHKTLHDVHGYGYLSFPEVFVKSSNIGTVKLASRLKPNTFQRYIKMFGFGYKTGIDLEGEAPGFIRGPKDWSKTSPYAIPMGQEIMVTALQLARAASFVANGGYRVEPKMVTRIEDVHGVTLRGKSPSNTPPVEQPESALNPAAVEILKEILWRVTEEGTGKNARIKGIPVAGKTGTAQKILASGRGYSHSNFISTFIGFAPADHPLLSMVVMVDDPRPSYYGGTVAAPVFSEVMEAALAHVGYSPN